MNCNLLFFAVITSLQLIHAILPTVKVEPPYVEVLEGENVTVKCSVNRSVAACGWYGVVDEPAPKFINPGDILPEGIAYYGEGMEKGDCGVRIPNVTEKYSRVLTCLLTISVNDSVSGNINVTVAKAPLVPQIIVTEIDPINNVSLANTIKENIANTAHVGISPPLTVDVAASPIRSAIGSLLLTTHVTPSRVFSTSDMASATIDHAPSSLATPAHNTSSSAIPADATLPSAYSKKVMTSTLTTKAFRITSAVVPSADVKPSVVYSTGATTSSATTDQVTSPATSANIRSSSAGVSLSSAYSATVRTSPSPTPTADVTAPPTTSADTANSPLLTPSLIPSIDAAASSVRSGNITASPFRIPDFKISPASFGNDTDFFARSADITVSSGGFAALLIGGISIAILLLFILSVLICVKTIRLRRSSIEVPKNTYCSNENVTCAEENV